MRSLADNDIQRLMTTLLYFEDLNVIFIQEYLVNQDLNKI
jgi:hypothetical protein